MAIGNSIGRQNQTDLDTLSNLIRSNQIQPLIFRITHINYFSVWSRRYHCAFYPVHIAIVAPESKNTTKNKNCTYDAFIVLNPKRKEWSKKWSRERKSSYCRYLVILLKYLNWWFTKFVRGLHVVQLFLHFTIHFLVYFKIINIRLILGIYIDYNTLLIMVFHRHW